MTETTKDLAEQGVDVIIAEVAGAMRAAAQEYGPEAIDLAMLAYRVAAIESLVWGAAGIALLFACWWAWGALVRATPDYGKPFDVEHGSGRTFGIGGLVLCCAASVAMACDNLFHFPTWAAAFGYPELMIATKALIAAGLM